jgi:predicted small lipoprotein YifL
MSTSRWTNRVAALAAILLAALALAGCGIGAQADPVRLPPASVAVVPPAAATPSPPTARQVTVYLVDAEGRLRPVAVGGQPGPYVSSALGALVQVGSTLTAPSGLRTLVPRGTTLGRVVVYPSDVLVDLGPQFLSLTGQDQVLATAQLVYTATERRPGAGVRISADGREIPLPSGDGSLRDGPVGRADYDQMVVIAPPTAE